MLSKSRYPTFTSVQGSMYTKQDLQFTKFGFLALLAFAASEPSCNDHERGFLDEVARQRFGIYLIYAIDETTSSQNALDTVYNFMNYSYRNPRIPFLFNSNLLILDPFNSKDKPGFCPSDSSFELLLSRVESNRTMFGVFYACNTINFQESVLVLINRDYPLYQPFIPSGINIQINRRLQSKFCRCEQIQERFIKSCIGGHQKMKLGLVVLFIFVAIFFVHFLLKVSKGAHVSSNAVDVVND